MKLFNYRNKKLLIFLVVLAITAVLGKYITTVADSKVSNLYIGIGQVHKINFDIDSNINNYESLKIAENFFILGTCIIAIIYCLGILMKGRKEKSTIYFGLLCLIFIVRLLFSGDSFFVSLMAGINMEIYTKVYYLTVYSLVPIFSMFIYEFYPKIISREKIEFLKNTLSLYAAIVVIFPVSAYDYMLVPFQIIAVYILIYIAYRFILNYFNKEERFGGKIIIPASILITFASNFFNIKLIYQHNFYTSIAILILVLIQAYVLAGKFSTAFNNMEELSEKLKIVDKLKDEFLANTSHELRAPLNGIIGLSEIMLSGNFKNVNEEEHLNIKLINSSAKRLSNLVNDILDFSKIKNNDIAIEKKPVDIKQVIHAVTIFCNPFIQGKSITIEEIIPENVPLVFADENRLQQILYNLIGNAIKFTNVGSVTISAEVQKKYMEITIEDTGIGIPKDSLEDIFKPYEQMEDMINKRYAGSGIGLNITKKLIELQGGDIRVESEVDKGSKFIFTLPLCNDKAMVNYNRNNKLSNLIINNDSSIILNTQVPNTLGKYKILIVDDEPINLKVLQSLLVNEHYCVYIALNGEEALEIIELEKNLDLVILDAIMPNMLGYEVCRIIRQKYPMYELPILMMSTDDCTESIETAYECGANDYLKKPFNKTALLTRVKTLLKLNDAIEEALKLKAKVDIQRKRVIELNENYKENKKKLNEIVEYDKFKTEFFANISHELRTPLNVIWSTLQLINTIDDSKRIGDKDIKNYFGIMNQNCLRLLRLINNLIDSTRIDGGFLTLNLCLGNIIYFVEEMSLSVAQYIETKGINLIFDTEVEEKIMAFDIDKLERIILNILSNAVKFTEQGGTIWVNIYDLEDKVRISIRDTGIGIPKDKQKLIFERFAQVDRTTTRIHEGSGIGLSLVKSLVEMHEGSINLTSEEGHGSEFIIELPTDLSPHNKDANNLMYNSSESKYVDRINIEFSDIYM